jgi:hypothetical protein
VHSDLRVDRDGDALSVAVTVTNPGDRPTRSFTLVHASRQVDGVTERVLLGFARAQLAPRESRLIRVRSDLAPLSARTGPGQWEVRPGSYVLEVGAHAGDRSLAHDLLLP